MLLNRYPILIIPWIEIIFELSLKHGELDDYYQQTHDFNMCVGFEFLSLMNYTQNHTLNNHIKL